MMLRNQRKWEPDLLIWLLLPVILAVLGCVHLLDVRAGVLESGDTWQISRYLMLVALGIGTAIGTGYLLFRRRCCLETVFVFTALILGVLYLYILPPLSAPDEARHYISAYQLSNRMMGLPATAEDGKVPVREEDWFAEDSCWDFDPYVTESGTLATDEDGADGAKVLGQVLTAETYRLIHEKGMAWEEPRLAHGGENESDIVYGNGTVLSNHHPVVTTPLAYVMPALGITLARLIGLNSTGLLYMGCLFNLLMFVSVTYLAMRRMPFGKEVLFGVTLLPMVIQLSASFSYDIFIMAGIFYFTAHCLYLAYEAEWVRPADILILALVMAIVGPCKMIYTVFMGLCLLIPVRKFHGWGKWAVSAGCVLAAWVAAMILINSQTVASYATETENYIDWAGEAGYSLTMLIHQPIRCAQLFFNTVVWQAEYWHMTVIGAYLGNIDTVLDVPYLVVVLFTLGLLGLVFRKPGENLVFTGRKRIWIWFLCLLCAGAAMFSMLLAWTPVSSRIICGVQGRYFLPFLPIFLMSVKNDTVVLTKDRNRQILYLMCGANAYVVMRIFSIVCMRL